MFRSIAVITMIGWAAQQTVVGDTSVTIIDAPNNVAVNDYYVNSREPLRQYSLIKLPVGNVRPQGWLVETLRRQRDGITGHLPKLSAWLQGEDNAWLQPDGHGKWGWEEVPYWLKGYISLAYLLDDPEMVEESHTWIEAALASQRSDGNFGPLRVFGDDGSQDYWANMIMLFCLQSYYEHSGDERVLALMTNYFRFQLSISDDKFLTHYWQHMRGGDNLYSVYWLFNRTGDKWLLELAEKLHRNTADWSAVDGLPNWHNVNIAQAFGQPATYYILSKNEEHLHSAYRNFQKVRRIYGQVPGGMFGADENARKGFDDPRQAIETCGMVEQMLSNETLLRITGDTFWADHLEDVAFNSLPAAFMPDYRSLRYLTSPNMVSSDRHNHSPGYENRGPMTMMNPLSHRCCQHNHSHGWPYFVEHLWMATCDNGLCAAVIGPSEVTAVVGDGVEVFITEDTRYPFEEEVRLSLKMDTKARFPLYIRIPNWCENGSIAVNGTRVAGDMKAGHYVRIEREWQPNDTIQIQVPMELRVKVWHHNHSSVSVSHGPLTYSLLIGEDVATFDARTSALQDSQWQRNADFESWPAFEITPSTPWNFGLVLSTPAVESFEVQRRDWPEDNYPFAHDSTPITLKCKARRIPEWTLDRHGLCSTLQDSPVRSQEPTQNITLVPMGAARLRISAFPTIDNGPEAHIWDAVASPKQPPYQVSASHCFELDTVNAVADDLEPESSGDERIPRHTFWPRTSSLEWMQADFEDPKEVSEVGIYWYDDRRKAGGCRVPREWCLLYRDSNGGWAPVETDEEYGVETDRYNSVSITPIYTTGLRVNIMSRTGFTAGVLEWTIE